MLNQYWVPQVAEKKLQAAKVALSEKAILQRQVNASISPTSLKLSKVIQTMKQLAFLGALLALTATNQLNAAIQVPDSVIWQEAIVYSTPDGEALEMNIAQPKLGDSSRPLIADCHFLNRQAPVCAAG